jgi:glycerol-3-phosphate dehydrogenase
VFKYDVPRDIAKHLIKEYGTTSLRIVKLGKEAKLTGRIMDGYPFYEAEILHGIRSEMA